MITAEIVETEIDSERLILFVSNNSAGAIVTFNGVVRNHDKGRAVSVLKYEIHPSAQKRIEEIASQVVAKYEVINVAVAHRYGEIKIGESAFFVAVSSAHRKEAFQCSEELVEKIKAELPIWKFQEFNDGTSEWVNSA